MNPCGKSKEILDSATIAARQVAAEQRPGIWDRLRCAVGKCRLRWHNVKEGPVHNGPVQVGYYRTYEGICPICNRSKFTMEKAT